MSRRLLTSSRFAASLVRQTRGRLLSPCPPSPPPHSGTRSEDCGAGVVPYQRLKVRLRSGFQDLSDCHLQVVSIIITVHSCRVSCAKKSGKQARNICTIASALHLSQTSSEDVPTKLPVLVVKQSTSQFSHLGCWREVACSMEGNTLRLARLHDTQRDQRPRTRDTEGMVVRSVRCSSCLFRYTAAQGCAHLRVHFAEPGAVRDVGPGCVRIQ